jgi:murein DD-endopeptidase MepM/ murein hydrolase activator NlpD
MRTITLVTHNRPKYAAEAVIALTDAILKSESTLFDLLIFSIDPGDDDGFTEACEMCNKAGDVLSENGIIDCAMYVNDKNYGASGNTLLALNRAFDQNGSDFNLSIEEDALLTEDALLLADWFAKMHGDEASPYLLMSMCNHALFGKGKNPGGINDDPSYLVETPYITSPFAWCASKHAWPFLLDSWDRKVEPPNGWDFSLSFSMRLAKKKAIHPVLSRCKNIGEVGTNTNSEVFALTQKGLKYSDGKYVGPYFVVAKLQDGELDKIDPWMASEIERQKAEDERAKQSGN